MGAIASQINSECLLGRLIRRRSKKTSKLRVTGLCAGNSPETGEFPAQRASNAENVSIYDVIMMTEKGIMWCLTTERKRSQDYSYTSTGGERGSAGHQWIPLTNDQLLGILCFICCLPGLNKFLNKQSSFRLLKNRQRISRYDIVCVRQKMYCCSRANFIYFVNSKCEYIFHNL